MNGEGTVYCGVCGMGNDEDRPTCWHCGHAL